MPGDLEQRVNRRILLEKDLEGKQYLHVKFYMGGFDNKVENKYLARAGCSGQGVSNDVGRKIPSLGSCPFQESWVSSEGAVKGERIWSFVISIFHNNISTNNMKQSTFFMIIKETVKKWLW